MKDNNNKDKIVSDDPFEQIDEYIANVNKILADNPDENELNSDTENVGKTVNEGKTDEQSSEQTDEKSNEQTDEKSDKKSVDGSPKNKRKKNDVAREASSGLKGLGIISIVLVIMGAFLIGIAVYKLAIKPDYEKKNVSDQINYPYLSTNSDAYPDIVPLATVQDATASDAVADDALSQDAD